MITFRSVCFVSLFCAATLLSSCNSEDSKMVQLTIKVEKASKNNATSFATPGSTAEFNCIAVDVMASDIPNIEDSAGSRTVSFPSLYAGDACSTYPGVVSNLVSLTNGGRATVSVPSGSRRLVRVLGFTSSDGTCSFQSGDQKRVGASTNSDSTAGKNFKTRFPEIHVLADKTIDIFSSTEVELRSTYRASTTQNLNSCFGNSTVTPVLSGSDITIYEGSSTTQTITLTAASGTSVSSLSVTSNNAALFPTSSELSITNAGVLTVAPVDYVTGTATLTITAVDSSGGTSTKTLSVTVLPYCTSSNPALSAATAYSGGDGSTIPYKLCTESDLETFAQNCSDSDYSDCGSSFELRGNVSFTPSTTCSLTTDGQYNTYGTIGTVSHPFTGRFDGNGYQLTGLCMRADTLVSLGLFGALQCAQIDDVLISGFKIRAQGYVGSVVGYIGDTACAAGDETTIQDVQVDASTAVYSGLNGFAGGIVGAADGTGSSSISLDKVSFLGTVANISNPAFTTGAYYGGIIGYVAMQVATVNITRARFAGTVDALVSTIDPDAANVGGITGYASGVLNITNAESHGTVRGVYNVGGIIGQAVSGGVQVSNSYSNASVVGYNSSLISSHQPAIGGLIGYRSAAGSITNSFYSGALSNYSSATSVVNYGSIIGYDTSGTTTNVHVWDGACLFNSLSGCNDNGATSVISATSSFQGTFASSTLGWSSSVWKFATGAYPLLCDVSATCP